MLELIQAIPFSFAALFPVINPVGSTVIFLTLVRGASSEELNRLAFKIALYTAVMLSIVVVAGSWILRVFGITIPIVLIGGGLVLAYIGWQILNEPQTDDVTETPEKTSDQTAEGMAFYPLTMPVTSGPGCIAVAIALGAHAVQPSLEQTALGQLGTIIGVILVSLTVFICYRYAHEFAKRMKNSGRQVIMRLAGFINLCIGLELVWHGMSYLI